MASQNRSFIARGTILPSVFVKQKAGDDHGIIQAVADDEAVGICYEGTRDAPVDGITPTSAVDGESCRIYVEDEPCEVIAGATIAAGDKLKPNADAHAIPTTTAGDIYSAIAAAGAVAGQRCKCTVRRGTVAGLSA
tara:strand:- start:108 stop:515 length:408 start_codon:yes stop_codon:yes gene_type:complete